MLYDSIKFSKQVIFKSVALTEQINNSSVYSSVCCIMADSQNSLYHFIHFFDFLSGTYNSINPLIRSKRILIFCVCNVCNIHFWKPINTLRSLRNLVKRWKILHYSNNKDLSTSFKHIYEDYILLKQNFKL